MIMANQSSNSGLQGYDYYAFISYCHQDEKWAKWLHEKLERYHLPAILCKEQSLPRDIKPIFRYPTDMPTGNLHKNIHKELETSKRLIIICSPRSAKSEWVNTEVQHFIDIGRYDEIIPFIIEGEPGGGDRECFPEALRVAKTTQLLGVRVSEYGRQDAFLLVVSGLFGIKYDQLKRRHEQRRKRQIIFRVVTTFAAVIIVCCGFLFYRQYELKKNTSALYDNAQVNLQKANVIAEILNERLAFEDDYLSESRKQKLVSDSSTYVYNIVTQNDYKLDDSSYYETNRHLIDTTHLETDMVEDYYYKLGRLNEEYRYLNDDIEAYRASDNQIYYEKIKRRTEIILLRTEQLAYIVAILFNDESITAVESYIALGTEINNLTEQFVESLRGMVGEITQELDEKKAQLYPSQDDDAVTIASKARTLKDLGYNEQVRTAYQLISNAHFDESWDEVDKTWVGHYVMIAELLLDNPNYSGGCYIFEVKPHSMAEQSGLLEGDIILSYNDLLAPWPKELTTAVESSELSNNTITVLRWESNEFVTYSFVVESGLLGISSIVV
jgi:hypothetical protein